MNKDVEQLVRDLRQVPGITVKKGGGGHYKVRREGKVLCAISATPSDWRWRQNCLAQLRQNGIVLDGYHRAEVEAERTETVDASPRRGHLVSPEQQDEALAITKRICAEAAEAYRLPINAGKTVGYGTRPLLEKILVEYHQATGVAIPKLHYAKDSPYDPNNDSEMVRLLVISLTDFAAGVQTKVTHMAYAKMKFAEAAWDWHLGMVSKHDEPVAAPGDLTV